jgi:hypothetical protein
MTRILIALVVLRTGAALAEGASDAEPRRVAMTYLNALTGAGDEAGKDLLLGGVTMNAQLFALENAQLQAKDPVRKEELDLAHAVQLMADYDRSGRAALTRLLGLQQQGDELRATEVSQADAARLLGPTREKAAALLAQHPVLATVLRVDREVYWHPKNPMRAVLARAGNQGSYTVELHLWKVLTVEGPGKTPRVWPLRVLRFRSAKVDTGWKVLPASDWNAE